ncbi:hypothetical protein [Micromonospora sp. NPDC051006]|uniref:hypothetical protein n=1 Tax=Micromonospora sp. NPDC051006 TaxID=3364283 RepID=UPI0037B0160C
MRRKLDDAWSIDLTGAWQRERPVAGLTTWRAPGRSLRVGGVVWRCASAADIIASIDLELPADPAGKVGEGGSGGVGARAAWLYRDTGDAHYTLHGYNFTDGEGLETVFVSADTADTAWAFAAWRSVTHAGSPHAGR